MKILLIAKDLFESSPNGGSNFYKYLIDSNQQHQFYYWATKIDKQSYLITPKNVHVVQATELEEFMRALLDTVGNQFDVIDIPSWDFEANSLIHKINEAGVTFKKYF